MNSCNTDRFLATTVVCGLSTLNRHTSSSIGKHFRDKHSSTPKDLTPNFTILKKCNSKFDRLIYEMFFINELRPSLNVQRDSIRAKVFK